MEVVVQQTALSQNLFYTAENLLHLLSERCGKFITAVPITCCRCPCTALPNVPFKTNIAMLLLYSSRYSSRYSQFTHVE